MKHKLMVAMITVIALSLSISAALASAQSPGAPSGLTLTIKDKGFLLTWQASSDDSGVTGYEIERSTLASGPFETIGRTSENVLEYHDLKVQPENIYYYKVKALTRRGHALYSNTVTGELPGF